MSEQKKMTEYGTIVDTEGDFAYIQLQASSGCSGCASSASCGTSVLAHFFATRSRGMIKVYNKIGGEVGARVALKMAPSQLLYQAFIAYGLPLIGLFALSLLASWLGSVIGGEAELWEGITIIAGVVGVFLGWLVAHRLYQPVLPEVIEVMSKECG